MGSVYVWFACIFSTEETLSRGKCHVSLKDHMVVVEWVSIPSTPPLSLRYLTVLSLHFLLVYLYLYPLPSPPFLSYIQFLHFKAQHCCVI